MPITIIYPTKYLILTKTTYKPINKHFTQHYNPKKSNLNRLLFILNEYK